MEFSAGLVLQYARQLATAPVAERKPFYLSVPDKEQFTVHFSGTLLLHYLFEDYFSPEPAQVSVGDKVELFGSITKYTGAITESGKKRIRLLFSDGVTYNAPDSYRLRMVKVGGHRMLNTIDHFKKQRRTYLENNDLNSLFGLGTNEAVNPNTLTSKLYLVTGRGYAVSTREKLKNESCINQSFDKLFRVGTNLIVTPNLEGIAPIFNTSTGEDHSYFTISLTEDLTQLLEVYDGDSNVVDVIKRLATNLEKQDFSEIFRQLFDRLANSIDDPYRTRLLNLAVNMPVAEAGLPDGLKMVVLDNIDLAVTYTNTINGLLARGIPVIILSDRSELASRKDNASDGLMSSYRFYWSRERLKSLIETETVEYCDGQFWQRCLQYANQEITVRSYNDSVGDRLFNTFESNPVFARLDGFENLKKAYYQYLRPTLYLLKNTPGIHPNIIQSLRGQVDVFSEAFKLIENQLPANLATSLADGLIEIRNYTANPKFIPEDLPVFIQQIEFPEGIRQQTAQLTPKALRLTDLKQSKTDTLVFTGFPYREWNGKYLFDAVFHSLIRSVIIRV